MWMRGLQYPGSNRRSPGVEAWMEGCERIMLRSDGVVVDCAEHNSSLLRIRDRKSGPPQLVLRSTHRTRI